MRVTPHDCLRLGVLAAAFSLADGRAAEPQAPVRRSPDFISPAAAAALSEWRPKYTPFIEQPATPDAADIFYLPKVTVTKEPPRITEFEMLLPKARLDLALATHPGLRMGPLTRLNHGVAREIQQEEREAAKRAAVTEQVLNVAVTDDARARDEINMMRAATAQPNNEWRDGTPGSK